MGWWESEEGCFWPFKPFSKLKITIYNYWTLVKIKIAMTCICKEYEDNFLVYKMKIVILVRGLTFGRGNKNLVGVYWGGLFPDGGKWSNFWNVLFRNIIKWTYKICLMVDRWQQVSQKNNLKRHLVSKKRTSPLNMRDIRD